MTTRRSSGSRSSVAVHYIDLTRRIVSAERTGAADTQIGLVLTFVAGATNAGGFLAIGQYTSHMSGIFSAMADHLALGWPAWCSSASEPSWPSWQALLARPC